MTSTTPEISRNSSTGQRSPQREILAAAIRARNEADQREATLAKAAERARADAFLARRDVDDAQRALTQAQETARLALADAYIDGEAEDDGVVTEAERTLAQAQRRLSDLAMVEQELSARSQPAPGRSLPDIEVGKRVRAVVKDCPTLRRLVDDFRTAERTFQQYHSTLRWLAAHDLIPDDLKGSAPKPHETYHTEPDPKWTTAIESLKRNPDAELPA
jgi:hypothetical protein